MMKFEQNFGRKALKVKMKKRNSGLEILVAVAWFCMIGVRGGSSSSSSEENNVSKVVDVGVILDLDEGAMVGKMSRISISMAISDYYDHHRHQRPLNHPNTRIQPHFHNSASDDVVAASAAIDLMKNVQVKAIIGPHRSTQADFVIDIANKAKVPMISLATSPSISPKKNPYFIRAAQCSSSQAKPIAAIVKAFDWREVVFIYEDSEFGRGVIPYLTDAMTEVNAQVKNRSVLSPLASDVQIGEELYRLMTMQTRVFVVHLLPTLASRLFSIAHKVGMMKEGYAWIVTDVVTSLLHSLSDQYIDSMQGVLGVKPYIPISKELGSFTKRWKKQFRQEYPDIDRTELDMFGIWAYDSTIALAMAFDSIGVAIDHQRYRNADNISRDHNLTDLDAIGTSEIGSELVPLIRNIRFKGLTGDFHVVDGQLKESPYEIMNVVGKGERGIGIWTPEQGIKREMKSSDHHLKEYTTNKNELGVIVWPGDTSGVPRGWEIPTNERKLRVGVPVKAGFEQFIKAERDNQTHEVTAVGFCVDVFEAVLNELPYNVPVEYILFENPDGSYDDLIEQISLGIYDAVVGDITIVSNRSRYVDFTLPYTESGVTLIVPIQNAQMKNAWIFLEPLEIKLWVMTAMFFIYTGFVVWVLEHRVNKEFRGPPYKQMGMILYYSFSTLVYAHREKVMSNLTRFVVIVWVFVVLVLTSSYTASLTSMLTIQKFQPEFNNIQDLLSKGENIGYQDRSFTLGMLKKWNFQDTKIKNYSTPEDYDNALSNGSLNGGVAAILEELPYIRVLLSKYCTKYTTAGPIYRTAGFGFALAKGSPLVPDISQAVLQVTEEKVTEISNQWLGKEADCPEQGGAKISSDRLKLDSFKGLFFIAGISSSSALILSLLIFIYENRGILLSEDSVWEKLTAIAKTFDEEKVQESDVSRKTIEMNEARAAMAEDTTNNNNANNSVITTDSLMSPEISAHHEEERVFGQEESYSSTEPGTPIHETINIPVTP